MRTSFRARATLAVLIAAAVLLSAPLAQGTGGGTESLRPSHPVAATKRAGWGLQPANLTATLGVVKPAAEVWPAGSVLDWSWQNPKPTGAALKDVHFVDASTGWVAGAGTLLKTTDGGASWTAQETGSDFDGTNLDFADASHGWCTSLGGADVLRTQDGGAHWIECDVFGSEGITGDYTSNQMSDISFPSTSVGYIVEEDQKVHKTSDGGVTWKVLSGTVGKWPVAIDFIDADTGWAVGDYGTILKTTNGGATWTKKPAPTVDEYSGYGDVDFVNANVGWISGYDGLFKTTDGGNTWAHQASVPDQWEIGSIHFLDSSRGWLAATSMRGGPSVETTYSILRTEDGGEHWTQVDLGTEASVNGISFIDGEHGWAAGAGGPLGAILDVTSDGGKTWSAVTTGTAAALKDVSATGTGTAIAAGVGGTILRTANGGQTWATRNSETTQTLWALASANASETWAVGDTGTIRHTADGGDTWESQDSGTKWWLGVVDFTDAQHGWVAGGGGTLLKTSDGGGQWKQVEATPRFNLYGVDFVDEQTGWVVADANPALYKTADGGLTWTAQGPDFWNADSVGYVAFADAQHGWVGDYNGDLAHTSDGGRTWTPQYLRAGWSLRALRAIDASSAVAVTQQGQIARTDDAGETWWLQVAPSGTINDIDFADKTTGWVVGESGLIAKTVNGGGTQPQPAQLIGTVRSAVSGARLAGVAVELETYPTVYTDAAGRYRIPNIVPGTYDQMTLRKSGYSVHVEPFMWFVDGEEDVLDVSLLAKSAASVTSARLLGRRLVARGTVTPKRRTTVTLEYSRLVGKTFVRKSRVKVKTASSGKFSHSRSLARGTWRVRIIVSQGKGYSSATSTWKVVKVR